MVSIKEQAENVVNLLIEYKWTREQMIALVSSNLHDRENRVRDEYRKNAKKVINPKPEIEFKPVREGDAERYKRMLVMKGYEPR